ncbi:metallophosphoesterase [Streptococcus hillyeri]|uniref:Phosphoesterase n=1 Tax=Streptococcus hillyeri TaxID=2282420 RepID=A0A3L9E0Y7_9STRE|nr:YfcE family phosphodiesterase [Streptococcus hillyeri]RLY04800.1 YfcE family phosphodiesterase [Streptococcus hillyeri]
MVKIAVLGDIHGNTTALEAVLADAKEQSVEEYWILGDLLLPGHGRMELFNLLNEVNSTIKVRGNWDDCLLEVLNGDVGIEDCEEIYLNRLVQYAMEELTSESVTSIRETPMHVMTDREGISFSLSHQLPEKNYGWELGPTASQETIDGLFEKYPCDVAIYGHTHIPVLRYSSKGQLLFNPGSVGNPFFPWEKLRHDLRAQYAILTVDEHGVSIDFRKVTYDVSLEVKRAKEKKLPFVDLYQSQVETGVNRVHDREWITTVIEENHYLDDVKGFKEKLLT